MNSEGKKFKQLKLAENSDITPSSLARNKKSSDRSYIGAERVLLLPSNKPNNQNPQETEKKNWYLQINSPYGRPIATELQIITKKDEDFRQEKFLRKVENTDFSIFEKRIKQIEKQLNPIEKK